MEFDWILVCGFTWAVRNTFQCLARWWLYRRELPHAGLGWKRLAMRMWGLRAVGLTVVPFLQPEHGVTDH